MVDIRARTHERKLLHVDGFHRIQGRIEREPTADEYRQLRKHARSVHYHPLSQAGFRHARTKQECRISLNAPDLQAIKILDALGLVITLVEIARDYRDPQGTIERALTTNFIHRHQRDTYRYDFNGTHYSNKRSSERNLVFYRKDIPGFDKNALHTEFRLKRGALKKAGIKTAIDLTAFDFDQYWRQHLILRTVEREEFKRLRQRPIYGQGAVQRMMKRSGLRGRALHRTFPVLTFPVPDKRADM